MKESSICVGGFERELDLFGDMFGSVMKFQKEVYIIC